MNSDSVDGESLMPNIRLTHRNGQTYRYDKRTSLFQRVLQLVRLQMAVAIQVQLVMEYVPELCQCAPDGHPQQPSATNRTARQRTSLLRIRILLKLWPRHASRERPARVHAAAAQQLVLVHLVQLPRALRRQVPVPLDGVRPRDGLIVDDRVVVPLRQAGPERTQPLAPALLALLRAELAEAVGDGLEGE